MSKKVPRLFQSFQPSHYNLEIELIPESMSFRGSVKIIGKKTGRPSKRITLHQKDLNITRARISKREKTNTTGVEINRVNSQKKYDEIRLHSDSMLYPGEYTIELDFTGRITEPMNGLYPCHFNYHGEDKVLLATQFESHHAREVFPCIDEPEAKATFDLSIITPEGPGVVLSNTPMREQTTKDGKTLTIFETTPIMSTYLLAFVYGEVEAKQLTTKNGTEVSAYSTPANIDFVDFALEFAVRCLEFYEEYFKIPFPLSKIDMVALPDFASGAMENWGLITYREQCMLVDPNNTSLGTKQYVAMVVAHELAHQWFGNLVTMQWWTDLWLNEGFASWIEYLAVDHIYPEWDMWTQFITDEQQPALKLDALANTHPIEAPINHPDEIRTIFDAISYNKGASVIHMLYRHLGPEDFQKGLVDYLKLNAYKNTTTADLWRSLEKASNKPVSIFMHKWTSQPGFPLLVVDADGQNDCLSLRQERFYIQKPAEIATDNWPIPTLTEDSTLPGQLDSESLTGVQCKNKYTKFNHDQSAFYRVLYSPEILGHISQNVSQLNPLDRLGLLSDSFETAKAGYGSAVASFKLLANYEHEDNAAVWDIIALNIGETRRVMDDDSIRESIKPFIRDLVRKQLDRLGKTEKKNDSHFDKLLRPTILGLASGADLPEVKTWCIDKFSSIESIEEIPADFRGVVLNTAARFGDANTWHKLLDFHNKTSLSEEKNTIAAALTSFEQPELIDNSLSLITTKTVRRQDSMHWVAYSLMNRHAKQATWQWIKDNWQWLDKELGSDLSFYRTPIYAARSFSSKDFKDDYIDFFADKNSPSLERSIKQGIEIIEWQTAWKNRDLDDLTTYFATTR